MKKIIKLATVFMIVAVMLLGASVTAYANNSQGQNSNSQGQNNNDQGQNNNNQGQNNNDQGQNNNNQGQNDNDQGQNENNAGGGDNDYEQPTPPAPTIPGSLVVVSQSVEGQRLNGAVFGVFNASDDMKLFELVTNTNGVTNSIPLEAGQYYLLALTAPQGFVPITERTYFNISEDTAKIVTVIYHPIVTQPTEPPVEPPVVPPIEPPVEPPILPPTMPLGRLLIHSRVAGINAPLSGTVFSIHRSFDNAFVAELVTDMFGEVMLELPVGEYFLRKIAVPAGIILNTDRINFIIRDGEVREVTVLSHPEPIITLPPVPQPGRLVIVNRTDSVNASLNGSIFAIFNAINDQFIAEVITNQFGEASFDLPAGDYFIRQFAVPYGVILNTDRFNFRIVSGEVRTVMVINRLQPVATPPPTTTPPPAVQYGRLLVTVRADGTREVLQGAVFSVHNSLTDEIVAWLTTDRFGEASVQLPAGDYFLRQTATARGYTFTTDRIPVRIQGDSMREITVTNRAEPLLINDPPPADAGSGRLLLFKRADGTRELLQGAVFALHEVQTNRQITTLTTDRFGEAAFNLPVGSYYLRQIAAPDGFILNNDRINFQITANETREITVTSRAEPTPVTPPELTPGRVLVTVRAQGTGENLQGVNFAVHHGLTDAVVGGLTTDSFGEASLVLPAGEYFIRQTSTPDGFVMNTDRIPVRIRDGAVTDIFVTRTAVPQPTPAPTPAPTQRPPATAAPAPAPVPTPEAVTPPLRNDGRIEIITRAAGSGNLLSGGNYAVYRASDSQRIGQVTTGANGRADIAVEPGMYFVRELRPTFGFLLETERIFLEVGTSGTVTVELTKVRDFNIAYLPDDIDGSSFIYITQTGQFMSVPHYAGGGLLMLVSLVFGGLAVWQFVKKDPKRRVSHG